MTTYIYVNAPKAAAAVAARRRMFTNARRVSGVAVPDTTALPAQERGRWERELRSHADDCGCRVGGAITLASLAIYMAAVWAGILPLPSAAARVGAGVAAVIVGGTIGKMIGLAIARHRVRKIIRAMTQRVLELELARTASTER